MPFSPYASLLLPPLLTLRGRFHADQPPICIISFKNQNPYTLLPVFLPQPLKHPPQLFKNLLLHSWSYHEQLPWSWELWYQSTRTRYLFTENREISTIEIRITHRTRKYKIDHCRTSRVGTSLLQGCYKPNPSSAPDSFPKWSRIWVPNILLTWWSVMWYKNYYFVYYV